MSNYYSNSRTNYFRVTDETKFEELFANLVSDDGCEVYDFTKVVDGVTLHGFGSYGSIDYNKIISMTNTAITAITIMTLIVSFQSCRKSCQTTRLLFIPRVVTKSFA